MSFSHVLNIMAGSLPPVRGLPPVGIAARQAADEIEMVDRDTDRTPSTPPTPPARRVARRSPSPLSVPVPAARSSASRSTFLPTHATSSTTMAPATTLTEPPPSTPPPAYNREGRGRGEHTMTLEARTAYETAFNTAYNASYSTTTPSWPSDNAVVSDRELQISRPESPPPAYNTSTRTNISRQEAVRAYSPPPAYTSDPYAPSLEVAPRQTHSVRDRPANYVWDWDPVRQRRQYIPRTNSVERDAEARELILNMRTSRRPGQVTNNPNPGERSTPSSSNTASPRSLESGMRSAENRILDLELGRIGRGIEDRAQNRCCGWIVGFMIAAVIIAFFIAYPIVKGKDGTEPDGLFSSASSAISTTSTTTSTPTGTASPSPT